VSDDLDILRASLLSGGPRELHITRASQWTDADQHPITRAEWESFAGAHPKLSQHGSAGWKSVELNQDGSVGSTDTGWTPIYAFTCKDGAKVWLSWRDDHVAARGELLGHEAALATLAVQCRARLLDDDEDEHLPDGSRVHWDEFRKPITPLDGAVTRYPVPSQRAGPAVREHSVLVPCSSRRYAGTVFTFRVKQPQSIAGRCWNVVQSVLSLGSVALIVLKLTGVIGWSWWWVLAPVWISGIPLVAVLCGLAVLLCWGWAEGRKWR
jgi:hypothetical protein